MHSLVIVVGDNPLAEVMGPFDETLAVPKYVVGPVKKSDKERFIEYYNEHTKGYHFCMDDFDELYAEKGDDWNDRLWEKDENGEWVEVSNWNQDGQWDWYEVGGRWAGALELKDGAEPLAPINFSWGWNEEQKRTVLNASPKRADIARLGDIANIEDLTAYAILKDGEWIDIGEGIMFTNVSEYLKGLPEDTIITCVDYHN